MIENAAAQSRVAIKARRLKKADAVMCFVFIDESYGRGTWVGRGLGVGATLGVGVTLGVEVGVGVGVGVISCTSNEPMSIRSPLTRSKPGPRWS